MKLCRDFHKLDMNPKNNCQWVQPHAARRHIAGPGVAYVVAIVVAVGAIEKKKKK